MYDFALPLLILHAFTFKTMDNLKHWLSICPRRQITVLDTHDGAREDGGAWMVSLPATYVITMRIPVCCMLQVSQPHSAREVPMEIGSGDEGGGMEERSSSS